MQQTQLNTTELGTTGLKITRIGFGAWALGREGLQDGGEPREFEDSIETIHRALALGVNWIDTAATEGFGQSEEIVGRAIECLDERPYVFSKASLVPGPGGRLRSSLKRDSILREAHESLIRLRVDAIDLYQMHWPIPDADIEEGWSAFAELKEQGLVRHIGVANFDAGQLRRIQSIAPVETLQQPYSPIERVAEDETLLWARRAGAGVLAYSPMGYGVATGAKTRDRSRQLALVERLTAVAHRFGTTSGSVMLAWMLRNPAVAGAIVGLRQPGQEDPTLDLDLDLDTIELSDADIAEIETGSRQQAQPGVRPSR
jgi:aryl-alcohol dehydrogenase-like predicted oxidoreductase